jgi:hypothetical protein
MLNNLIPDDKRKINVKEKNSSQPGLTLLAYQV